MTTRTLVPSPLTRTHPTPAGPREGVLLHQYVSNGEYECATFKILDDGSYEGVFGATSPYRPDVVCPASADASGADATVMGRNNLRPVGAQVEGAFTCE